MIGPFLRTRHGLAEPRYPHEKLETVLRETGGVVVFHEQVLRIIDAMTGCGLAEADLVRRHLSTEGGPDRTAPWFRAQALASGFDPVTIERVWQVVAAFGGFGFCKAHAAAFAIPVYQSAWLRRHHPAAFYAGVLTHDPGMYPKRVIIADARLSGVQVLPIDINASSGNWAVIPRGDDPPYPPMSPRAGLIAKSAIVSGPPAATVASRGDDPPRKETPSSSRTEAASSPSPHFPPSAPRPGASSLPDRPRTSRSPAARRLEFTGPLQALRLPGRSFLPGGRPPVPPDVGAAGPDRKKRDRIRPDRTDEKRRGRRLPVSPQVIRCSLREVKGISDTEITRIVSGQPYTSLRDFWNRAGVSRPVAERLVLIGAFDSLYTPAPNSPESPDTAATNTTSAETRAETRAGTRPGGCGNEPPVAGPLPQPPEVLDGKMGANCRVRPGSPAAPPSQVSPDPLFSPDPRWLPAPTPDISDMSPGHQAPGRRAPAPPRPSRRDLLARVGVLARQSAPARPGSPAVLDLFADANAEPADAEVGDGMADLVPAGQLRDLDLTERVEAELEILGFELSQHVLHFYADLLTGLGVVRSTELADQENGEMILVAGAKVATQTPAVRSGQRIIFASLDDAAGLVDLAFFESVQDRCAARLFASWLLVVRGRVRRAGAGPMAVTVNATECWDLAALEEIRLSAGLDAVRTAMAAGDAGPGARQASLPAPGTSPASGTSPAPASPAGTADSARPVTFANGFTLSPYAETGGPGGNLKHPPRTLWHASPGSTTTPDALRTNCPGGSRTKWPPGLPQRFRPAAHHRDDLAASSAPGAGRHSSTRTSPGATSSVPSKNRATCSRLR
jgi:error-prone DNA polymerase